MQYLCNTRGLTQFYPEDPARRAMVDSAMFYLIGTLYPLVARATYPALGFPQYPGEVGSSDADDGPRPPPSRPPRPRSPSRSTSTAPSILDGKRFIGGDQPSIADIRLAATLEFLAGIDYDLPAWAKEYMARDAERAGRRLRGARRRRARLHRDGEGARLNNGRSGGPMPSRVGGLSQGGGSGAALPYR